MRCAHCGRALTVPTRTIKTNGGPLHFGPVCARRVFEVETRTAYRVIKFTQRQAEPDPRQLELLDVRMGDAQEVCA